MLGDGAGTEEAIVSRFTENMFRNAHQSTRGMVTGEPHEPVRHTWLEVHERARRIAGGLAAEGVGHGDAIGVLAGFPVEIAPMAQALWMRGASLTMLHQPTPRTDLAVWAEDTMNVIAMIEATAVIVSEPFLVAIPVLEEKGIKVLKLGDLLDGEPPVMAQMVDVFNRYHSSVLGVEEIDPRESGSYGVIEGRQWDDGLFKIAGVV